MKQQEVKDVIIDLLEEIVNRTKYINHHHPGKDMSLDIDLVKDDLRLLYRKYEALKKLAEEQSGSGHVAEKQEAVEQLPPQVQHPPQQEQPSPPREDQPPLQEQQIKQPAQTFEAPLAEKEELPDELEAREREEAKRRFFEPAPIIHPPEKKAETEGAPPTDTEAETKDAEVSDPETLLDKAIPETKPQMPEALPEDDTSTKMETETVKVMTPPPPEEPPVRVAPVEYTNSGGNHSKNKTVLDLLSAYGQKTIGDQYAGEDNSIHQRIAGNREDKSIGARMQQNRISSIKEVIGVNEKFLFINELFDGNIQAYYDAIARLNEFDNMQAAFDYLNELGAQYSWDAGRSTSTIEKLASYVQRRYM